MGVKNNLYKLFMSYYREKVRLRGSIYRVAFNGGTNINFIDVYNAILEYYIPDRSVPMIDMDVTPYLQSIVLVHTKKNQYYFIIFMNKVDTEKYNCLDKMRCIFNDLNIIDFTYFIENFMNTDDYSHGSDIEFDKALDRSEADSRGQNWDEINKKNLMYSYWNWLHDMTQKDIEKCVLLDGPSFSYNIDEKNMYFTRPYLVELCESPNFYYIHFEKCRRLVMDNYNSILYRSKKRTIREEYKFFSENTNNYASFSKYWLHVPNSLSFLPLRHIGLVDTNFRFGYETWYTELSFSKDKSISVNEVYDLFDKQFKNVTKLMSVVMLKPKKNLDNYLIFFAIKDYSLKSINMIKSILNDYNRQTEIEPICNMNQNFEIPEWDEEDINNIDLGGCRTIEIEINSLVIGLYSKNPEYWISFSHGLGGYVGGLFYYDWIEMNASFWESSDWFKTSEDREFMAHYNARVQFLFIR